MYRNRCFVFCFCFVREITRESEKYNLIEACTNNDIWRHKFCDRAYYVGYSNVNALYVSRVCSQCVILEASIVIRVVHVLYVKLLKCLLLNN